jgi:hypothetical protein
MTSEDIARVTDWQSLVRVAHGMAVEKGWWDDGIAARPIENIVNNFHSEVSEAWEQYRDGRMATWYSDPNAVLEGRLSKPEGFYVELADLLIRIADAAGAHRIEVGELYFSGPGFSMATNKTISRLHCLIGKCDPFRFADMINVCLSFAADNNHDLWATIREKLAYNATRPYRHGGKRA